MKKILIVDDEAGIVEEVKGFLEEEGYVVRTADTAKQGIRILEEMQPEIVFIDVKLPDASGIEVLKASKEKCPKTKTVMVTGYVDQNLMDEAESLGRDSFLQKPFDLIRVAEEIERLTI
ncbi:MAG TPA: response regulator [Candidatus Omnitrophota bacterium]|jgi:DNA-binding NtrC family response regulator|nr:MAG: Sporulation initiation phosphotransferase F [Candidatus Omnitrophica bacterium ADurb.Bin314]HOE68834.1 response regulator [Candidatus Omnitrophota bacterium]HQB94372.1 response regulator [Candidatus Omnitrophota bacterium]